MNLDSNIMEIKESRLRKFTIDKNLLINETN